MASGSYAGFSSPTRSTKSTQSGTQQWASEAILGRATFCSSSLYTRRSLQSLYRIPGALRRKPWRRRARGHSGAAHLEQSTRSLCPARDMKSQSACHTQSNLQRSCLHLPSRYYLATERADCRPWRRDSRAAGSAYAANICSSCWFINFQIDYYNFEFFQTNTGFWGFGVLGNCAAQITFFNRRIWNKYTKQLYLFYSHRTYFQ